MQMPYVEGDVRDAHYHREGDGKPGNRPALACYCGKPQLAMRPALAQSLTAPAHRPTGQPRWLYAIYAADGTLLDVVQWSSRDGWPGWVEKLVRLEIVIIAVKEYDRWVAKLSDLTSETALTAAG
jgi:hypothetical protein